jgi:predicted sulfurtransferase
MKKNVKPNYSICKTIQFPDTYWHGGIFVFDGRKVIEPNTKEELKYSIDM